MMDAPVKDSTQTETAPETAPVAPPSTDLIDTMKGHKAHVESEIARMKAAADQAQQALNRAVEEGLRLMGVAQGIEAMIQLVSARNEHAAVTPKETPTPSEAAVPSEGP